MFKRLFRLPKQMKESRQQIEEVKEEDKQQRLLLREALQQLADARNKDGDK